MKRVAEIVEEWGVAEVELMCDRRGIHTVEVPWWRARTWLWYN